MLNFALSSKYSIDKLVTMTFSMEMDFKKGSKIFDFSKPIFTPMGF